MTSTHEGKESTKSNGLRQLLLQTGIQTIGSSLFTELITQKEKEMKMRVKGRRKFLINSQKHIGRK